MYYREEKRDIFTVPEDFYLAHCIASDLGMGKGIAVPMRKKFGLREKIKSSRESPVHPTCILVDRVFNLITKRRSCGKPTYTSLHKPLEIMRDIIVDEGIEKVAMPKIGCGLDRLQWPKVREMIHDLFKNVEVEILVCVWR